MDTDTKSEEIVGTILKLAENLNLETVAEGIENRRRPERLRELCCHYGRGCLFSKPVRAEEIAGSMERGPRFEMLPVADVRPNGCRQAVGYEAQTADDRI